MNKFKVSCFLSPKTSRYGYLLPDNMQPLPYEEYFATLKEAMEFASKVHTKKVYVNIYDLEGPEVEDKDSRVWLVGAWDRNIYFPNSNYELNK